tara:strand:- start:1012 stop:1341 length:330 start_codon:yes stop_codon:yes gene_type:complete
MAGLPDCLLIVTARIDAEVEDAWNRWYDEVHLPEALACPGVLAGRRYRAAGPAATGDHGARAMDEARTYVAVYELAGPEALETPEFAAMRGWYQFTDHIVSRTQVFGAM